MEDDIMVKIAEAIRIGIIKASFDMEAHAVRLCPVDTGRLRNSIKVRVEGNRIILSSDTEYDEYVEFGTIKMRAQPFIRPAVQNGVEKFIPERVLTELRKI
jgi:HK97 gp10 family phage protein